MITDYLDAALGEGKPHRTSKGMQYSYKCPLCSDYKDRLFVNVDRQVFKCHNCDAAGSLITFISDYARIPWVEALSIYREYKGYQEALPDDLETEIYQRLKGISELEMPKHVFDLPEEFIPVEEARGKAGKKAVEYLCSRGVTLKMAEKYYIGYCAEGDYANRIIMPDFEDSELIYWQARTWEPKPKNKLLAQFYKKVLNPSLTEEQLDRGIRAVEKSEIVSNIDFILELGFAVICEGRFDSYSIGDVGACIHGKHLSDTQLMKLVENKDKIGMVAVMLDGDAFASTITTAKRLYKHFEDVLVCRIEDREMDPNKLGSGKCLEVINGAIPYSPMFEVKARIKGWL